MAHNDSLISDRVVSTAERIEDTEGPLLDELDPLEVKVEASLDGRVSEIIAVLTVGGPHIEVALSAGRVDGSWGGDTHSVPIMDADAEDRLLEVFYHYKEIWTDVTLA